MLTVAGNSQPKRTTQSSTASPTITLSQILFLLILYFSFFIHLPLQKNAATEQSYIPCTREDTGIFFLVLNFLFKQQPRPRKVKKTLYHGRQTNATKEAFPPATTAARDAAARLW